MYNAPDFIKVSVNVEEAFTSYCYAAVGGLFGETDDYCIGMQNVKHTETDDAYQCMINDME